MRGLRTYFKQLEKQAVALSVLLGAILVGMAILPVAGVPAYGGAGAAVPLSLEEAITKAMETSPALEIARLKLDQARLGYVQFSSKMAMMPPVPGETYENAKATTLARRKLQMAVVLAENGMEQARRDVRFQVEKAYYEALKAEENLSAARAGVKRAKEQLDNATRFYSVGTAPRSDVLAAEAQLAAAQAALSGASRAREVAMMGLNRAMGRDLDAPIELKKGITYQPYGEIDLDAVVARALERRLDLIQARENLAVAEMQHDLAEDLLGGSLLEANRLERQITELAAREAKLSLQQREQQVILEIRQAYLNIKGAEERYLQLRKAVEQAQESLRLATLRYEAGVGTSLEVTVAESYLAQAESQLIGALYDYNLAIAAFRTSAVQD